MNEYTFIYTTVHSNPQYVKYTCITHTLSEAFSKAVEMRKVLDNNDIPILTWRLDTIKEREV